jgi:glycosyltransferase involved in cell wall biosynthesis
MLMPPAPRVTIAIPTFQRPGYLELSVRSALAQTYPNLEIIVSDNHSPEGTLDWVESLDDPRLRIVRQSSNLGQAGNWNACLDLATGDYFLMLSDDDLLWEGAIQALLDGFQPPEGQEGAPIGFVYCRTRFINEEGRVIGCSKVAPELEDGFAAIDGFFTGQRDNYPCSILFRTSDLRVAGGYDPDRFTLAMDAAIWMQVAMRYERVRFLPQMLADYRIHAKGLTYTSKVEQWEKGLRGVIDLCNSHYAGLREGNRAAAIVKGGGHYLAGMVFTLLSWRSRQGGSRLGGVLAILGRSGYVRSVRDLLLMLKSICATLLPNSLFFFLKKLKNNMQQREANSSAAPASCRRKSAPVTRFPGSRSSGA